MVNIYKYFIHMILEKIPRIECVLIIPELITDDLTNIFNEFTCAKKSSKILKKYKKRIKTYNYTSNLIKKSFDKESNLNQKESLNDEYEIISKIFSNPNNFDKFLSMDNFNSFICSLEPYDKHILTKFIIDHIDRIINKYIKILIHIDDQVYVLSKQNKDNKKIFLKFFLPKIQKNINNERNHEPQFIDGSINSLKDNIHVTLLPTVEGHGLDGLSHLTFRIEGKKNVVFEYSKFASLNVDSNKLAVGIYPDEKCLDALIFKIIENLPKLVQIIKLKNFNKFDNDVLNIYNYSNMLDFITLDILNQLKLTNKLEYIFEKYFFSLGKETIKTIIDKLFRIVIFTFIELYFGIN